MSRKIVLERLSTYGATALDNADLLSVISKAEPTQTHELLNTIGGIQNLARLSLAEIKQHMTPAQAEAIKAALDLAKRLKTTQAPKTPIISSPDAAAELFDHIKYERVEYFLAAYLNTKNHVIKIETISIGSLNATIVTPREVFAAAIAHRASAVIVAHNHPSGDPTPSRPDIDMTKQLIDAGNIIGIDVLDHIIIGHNGYTSFKDQGLI